MELGKRLKTYRNSAQMSQEQLADQLYVSRQTISNWENDKSYPDIHSLLLLSDVFHVSLDTLVKGDIDIMKEKIDQKDIRNFNRDSTIFTLLMILCILSAIPLIEGLGIPGSILWGAILILTFYYTYRVEKAKKEHDIHTYKEIVAFTNGETLDRIEKAREEGKRFYQKALMAILSAITGLGIATIIKILMNAF